MRTVTNKTISMILLRTGTKSIRGLNYVRTVTKRLSPYLMKSEKGIIARGPAPYDGRGHVPAPEQKEQEFSKLGR